MVVLAPVVVGIRVLPYALWRRWTPGRGRRTAAARTAAASVPEIVRAINSASTVIPGGQNCLARAVAARAIFAWHGVATDLALGVARRTDGALRAHAWLRHDGRFILGEQGVDGFLPMPDLADRL